MCIIINTMSIKDLNHLVNETFSKVVASKIIAGYGHRFELFPDGTWSVIFHLKDELLYALVENGEEYIAGHGPRIRGVYKQGGSNDK